MILAGRHCVFCIRCVSKINLLLKRILCTSNVCYSSSTKALLQELRHVRTRIGPDSLRHANRDQDKGGNAMKRVLVCHTTLVAAVL
jgi:hypothetical protein